MEDPEQRLDRLIRWGVVGAIVTFCGLVLIWMLAVPLFGPSDESGHVAYGLALMHGHLPEAGVAVQPAFPDLGQRTTGMFVGTHPPLYYAVSGPLEWLGQRTGDPSPYLLLTRALNVALTVVNIVLVARLAGLVAPRTDPQRRATLVVVAAGLTATVPSLMSVAGSMYNDALALTLATSALVLLAGAVREGLTTRTLLLLALVCTLAMLTRVTLAPVVAVVVAGVVVLTLWPRLERRRPAPPDLWVGLGRAGVVAGSVLLGAGWFYALNLRRYGDPVGGSVLYPGVERREWAEGAEEGALHYLLQPHAVWVQLEQLGGLPNRHLSDPTRISEVLGAVIGVVLLAAAILTAVRALRGAKDLDGRGRWIVLGLVTILLAAWLELGTHVAQKGIENNRYLLTGLTAWAIGAGLLALAVRWRGVPVLAVVLIGCGALGGLAFTWAFVGSPPRLKEVGSWDLLSGGMRDAGVPAPSVVLAVLLAAIGAGLVLQVAALVAIGRWRAPDQPPTTPYSRSPASPRPGTM